MIGARPISLTISQVAAGSRGIGPNALTTPGSVTMTAPLSTSGHPDWMFLGCDGNDGLIRAAARFAPEGPSHTGGGGSVPPAVPPSGNGEGGDGKVFVKIADLMETSGVKFGTSGARGLVADLNDRVSYAYTLGFIQHLERQGELEPGSPIAIAGDLRPSTDRIMRAVGKAIVDKGYKVINGGKVPSPAIACYGIQTGAPSVMITGSHIPDDRNGIKYNKAAGEILKADEAGIKEQVVELPTGLFNGDGSFVEGAKVDLPAIAADIEGIYLKRYIDFFPPFLKGKKIGLYAHSAVGRHMLYVVLKGLGAEVDIIGESKTFIPVDTEAIRPEDVELAKSLAGKYFAIVSTDGDSDRPLIAGSDGVWFRGDVLGIVVSKFFESDAVAAPVSCNTALEKCGWFPRTTRTRIGSPYVIEGMMQAVANGAQRVVSYEANGGFLTMTDMAQFDRTLKALPTRDAFLPILATLWRAVDERVNVQDLVAQLPQRFTASDRLKNFPQEKSRAILAMFNSGDKTDDAAAIEKIFGEFGKVQSIDTTDGVRITFDNEEVVHLRPSGNAPEFRCYTEASSDPRTTEINARAMEILKTLSQS